jgi:endoglucanase
LIKYIPSYFLTQGGAKMTFPLEILQKFSECFGPPGGEGPVAHLLEQYLQSFCQLSRDGLGSVLAEKAGQQTRPRLMLAAHLDEIGFMVQGVTPQGYLRFRLWGWEPNWLPGKRLIIQSLATAGRSRGYAGTF